MADPAPTPRSSHTILLADDNAELRAATGKVLTRLGYQVIEAQDGADLNHKIASGLNVGNLPDLILSDNRMPWTSGLLVLERLRSRGCRVPFILMTAFVDSATQAAAWRLGARLISKPFRLEDLRKLVAAILEGAAEPALVPA